MEEYTHFSKIDKRILECHDNLSQLRNSLSVFMETRSQNSLDKLSSNIENIDLSVLALKNTIQTGLKSILDIESEEIDVIETDNGYEL